MGKAWGYNTALCSSSAPDAPIALRLGLVLAQLSCLPVAFSVKGRRTEPLESAQGIPEELCSTLSQRHCRNSGGNTSDFLSYCSQHPTFLLQPPHPTLTYPCPPLLSSPNPSRYFAHCFCIPFFFQAVTKKGFGSNDFRSALENGVLLCE